jgi:hypothetical protein
MTGNRRRPVSTASLGNNLPGVVDAGLVRAHMSARFNLS